VSQFLRDYIRTTGLQGKGEGVIANYDKVMGQEVDERMVGLFESDHQVVVEARVFRYVKDEWPGVLKVLLLADDAVRVRRSAFREGTDEVKARKRLLKKEREWQEKITEQFGFGDYFEHKYYDLVLDTTHMNQEQVLMRVLKELE